MQTATDNAHYQFVQAERAALEADAWDRWIAKAEQIIGHSLDGDDVNYDGCGYSIDECLSAFEAGMTPEAQVADIQRRNRYRIFRAA